MRLASYWSDTATRFSRAEGGPVEGAVDVAVIGAGFTGLLAARVAVLEARHVGAGGSGRSGRRRPTGPSARRWTRSRRSSRRRDGKGWRPETPRGAIRAERVILATGACTSGPSGYFRRRTVPVGSFTVATRPLTGAEIEATMQGRRTCVTSFRVGNYFRLSPDDRLVFGGRARFSAVSDARSDALSSAGRTGTRSRAWRGRRSRSTSASPGSCRR